MRTTCSCCQAKLNTDETVHVPKPKYSELPEVVDHLPLEYYVATQGWCRLCGNRCCASCLTLDEVCTTCKDTLNPVG